MEFYVTFTVFKYYQMKKNVHTNVQGKLITKTGGFMQ